jgi:hypothetical protein
MNWTRSLLLLTTVMSFTSQAQVRVTKLVIKSNEIYNLGPSDIIVADTLIMLDSARIRLNGLKGENYVRAQVAIIGNNCVIDGAGINGKEGSKGVGGITPIGPCMNGKPGRNGGRGLDGTQGINLFLYIDKLNTVGSLTINLSGGNGGDGGDGGEGGGGSPGTMHCKGGEGGNGGSGGNGGNGGIGGTLTIGGADAIALRNMLGERVTITNKGGSFGYGGISGYGGPPGLGPDKKNGKGGVPGVEGINGRSGNNGTILFED